MVGVTNLPLLLLMLLILLQVACFPERITKFDFNESMTGLEYSEKVVTESL